MFDSSMANFSKLVVQKRATILILLFILFFCTLAIAQDGRQLMDREEEEEEKVTTGGTKMAITEAARNLFSNPTTWDLCLIPNFVWTSFKQGWPCFPYCPNLEGGREQGKSGEEEEQEEEGTAEKVKEAVVKSLDESRIMVEDSARSAAEMVDKTVKKLKKTLSGVGTQGLV
ncbi:uncharacterized protein LOC127241860 isoform X2 [Andrographis paniculata]|uniref:uncharacterized protein LOC127241860 isoform X2 n=1 Tax=Andrographis paniculata TaxID=175694 RepID=UPI0021E8A603|nr:uncharacterized protein LOC127241860 isoform X2 [Andrographis paniculata]